MPFFTRVRNLVASPSAQQVRAFLPDDRAAPFEADNSYLRLMLADMSLGHTVQWFVDRFPSVTATVNLDFAGQRQTFTSVAGPPKEQLGPGVYTNYPLSPLLPYRGGLVEISAGLVALSGNDRIRIVLDILGGFSALIGPPLGTAVQVATQLNSGIDRLVQDGDEIVLGLHDSFVTANGPAAGNSLRAGYLAVVRADAAVFDKEQLHVVDSRLAYSGQPLNGYDYLLFHIESREERDNWLFPDLQKLLDEVKRRVALNDETGAATLRTQLYATIVTSADLTEPDRWRVAEVVKQQLARIQAGGLGAVGDDGPDLATAMAARRIELEDARNRPPIALSDFVDGVGTA